MKFSIVIPTFNEEKSITKTLSLLRSQAQESELEIIVVDAHSSDRTVELAEKLADQTIFSPPGRAIQMHKGALAASGELLVFLHADTRLPASWVHAALKAFAVLPRPAALAFRLRFDRDEFVYRFIAQASYWRSLLTGVPLGDQALIISKELYFRSGGFPPVPIFEEYFLIKNLKGLGRIQILEDSVTTSSRRYEKNGPLSNALKNSWITFLFYLGISPSVLARMYKP